MNAARIRALAALMLVAIGPAGAGDQAAAVFERASPSVYSVVAEGEAGAFMQGSAVVVATGQLATNHHVIAKGQRIRVGRGGQFQDAVLEAADAYRDLALLRVAGLDAPVVEFGRTEEIRVGQTVYAIGSPQGLELSLSEGIVASLRKKDELTLIQITAPISPGSSGGGLFDEHGRLIGFTTAQMIKGQNLNFASPVEWLGQLGVSYTPKALAQTGKTPTPTALTAPVAPVPTAQPAAPAPEPQSRYRLAFITVVIVVLLLFGVPATRWLAEFMSSREVGVAAAKADRPPTAGPDRLAPFRKLALEELAGDHKHLDTWLQAWDANPGNEAKAAQAYVEQRARALYRAENDRKWAEAKAKNSASPTA